MNTLVKIFWEFKKSFNLLPGLFLIMISGRGGGSLSSPEPPSPTIAEAISSVKNNFITE